MSETETILGRREALKIGGAAVVATVAGIPLVERVVGTESGHAELTVNGTIPDGTSVDATVEEYDSSDASMPINTQTVMISDSGAPHTFDGLEGMGDYEYAFELTLNADDAQELTPELEAPLFFEVPPPEPEDFEVTDYTTTEDWSAKPDDAEIVFDEYRLRKYQPKLVMSATTRERFDGLYGYVAQSDNKDTDVLCYWSKVDRVAEIGPIDDSKLGSDLGNHDPIYVFVDSETGDVDRIVYSTYHLGAAELRPDEADLETGRADKPTHVTFTVVDRWHHFRHSTDATGQFVELKSWPEVRSAWVNNNFGPSTTAVEDPWQLETTGDWRATDGVFSLTNFWLSLGQTIGWYGADQTDDLRE